MPINPHVTAHINLERIRDNVRDIRSLTGVSVLAVVKSDGYGLGAEMICNAIADLVDGFCVFSLQEAIDADIFARTGKRTLVLGPPTSTNAEDYLQAGVTPAVSTLEQASALRAARPALCVDTGMQRFACPMSEVESVMRAGDCREAFTHATRVEQAGLLKQSCRRFGIPLHAAASALLHEPEARLDAVRPGLAIYRGAARVVTRLVEARDSTGPVGYTDFVTARHGVILIGYSHGLRPGPCLINGTRRRILEVGMQSAFVELGSADRTGDEVVLLNEEINEDVLAKEWHVTPHHVLVKLCGNR